MVDHGLVVTGRDGPALLGWSCRACGATFFPRRAGCARCGGQDLEERVLSRTGKLFTFTIQGFTPKPPYDGSPEFEPYGVGYVDLGDVLVEGRLTENDASKLAIGSDMETVVVPYARDTSGNEVSTFAFRSLGADSSVQERS
jgi:uncharacterized protein